MGDFDTLLECRIGSSPLAGFTATDYSYTAEPQVREGFGRTGTKWSLTVEGYLSGADEAELAARQRAIEAAAAVGGQDIALIGPGGIDSVRLLASLAVDSGPHVAVQIDTGAGALKRTVKLTGEGLLGLSDGDWEVPPPRYTETTAKDVNDRPSVRRRGSVSPKRGLTAREVFVRSVLPAFQRDYPRQGDVSGPGWLVSQEYEEDAAGRSGTYTLTAERLASQIFSGSGSEMDVDGTASSSEERDEQGRRLKTISFDLFVSGDARALYERFRELATAGDGQVGAIVRERIEITQGRESRLRGSFTVLKARGATALLEFSQRLTTEGGEPIVASKSYPGIGPVLYAEPTRAATAVQSGRAVGLDAYPIVPRPVFPEDKLAEPVKVDRARVNDHEREVSWSYTFRFESLPVVTEEILAQLNATPSAGSSSGVGRGGSNG